MIRHIIYTQTQNIKIDGQLCRKMHLLSLIGVDKVAILNVLLLFYDCR